MYLFLGKLVVALGMKANGFGYAYSTEILDLTDPTSTCDEWAKSIEGSSQSVGGILDNAALLACGETEFDTSYGNSCFVITPFDTKRANSTHYNAKLSSSVVIFNENNLNQDALFITGGSSKISYFNHNIFKNEY